MDKSKNLRKQFADTMLGIGKKDKKLIVMVSDISHGILQTFNKSCKGQFYNVGICEQAIINLAAGMKKVGLYPVVHTIAPFMIERCYEQIKLDFGYQKVGVNLISVGGTYDYSKLGSTHHCYTDFSLLNHLPNCKIFVPGSAKEFDVMFKNNYKNNFINYYRLTEFPHDVEINYSKKILGKAIKINNGSKLTIIAIGPKLGVAQSVTRKLMKMKISVDLIYYNCIKPFDQITFLKSVRKTKKFFLIEEFSSEGGFYGELLKLLKKNRDIVSDYIGVKPFIHSYGSKNDLDNVSGLNEKNIIFKIKKLLDI